ncbi:MAG: transposase [Candidatus Acidiferrales bacterium]|jgi:transposase-like protein
MGRKPRVDRTPQEKWQIVQEGIKNGNVSETCRRYGVAPTLFYRWKDGARQRVTVVPDTVKDQRIRQMGRASEKQALKPEVLRKVTAGSCRVLHAQARELVKQGYEPTLVASALSISRSSLYYRNRPRSKVRKAEDPNYRETLISTLHCPPAQYGINRTTWTTKLLGRVMAARGYRVGHNTVSKIIKNAGYRFRKAKEVLTSNDPHYKDKLKRITSVLSRLGPEDRFFSIDEFGPFSVKKTGGRRLVAASEYPTIPQWQPSKGVLIVTAALELSTNQVTHFYSEKKNSQEMIKLLDILTAKYSGCKQIYFSWDAASWHASKQFLARVGEVNEYHHRKRHLVPAVRLAPLPARAQFLNVIESVFSGMATAIIHNSDYQSVDQAKVAIDQYFMERNEHFRQHPRRAGNKIWGSELVASEFKEGQNCKHPGWR